MKVRWECSIPLVVALACAAFSNSAQGQDPNAHLYIAHAAPGRNISSTTNPAFPVDISVHGTCVAQGVTFGEIRGPFTAAPGSWVVNVSVADFVSPCGGTTVFAATIPLTAGSSSLGIVALNSSNHVTGLIDPIDLSSVPVGQSRIILANTTGDNLTGVLTQGDGSVVVVSAPLAAGSLLKFDKGAGLFSATVFPEGSTVAATGPQEFNLTSRNVYLSVVAGSTTNDSVQLIGPKEIRGVF